MHLPVFSNLMEGLTYIPMGTAGTEKNVKKYVL